MKVFNACMLLIKRHYATFIIQFGIFIVLAVVISSLTANEFSPTFTEVSPNFTIVNRDVDSPLITGLETFMSENGNHVEIEDDRTALQDATFFHATDYILFIPQGFHESFVAGDPLPLETVMTTQIARGFLADSMVEQYLNLVRVYMAAGGDMSEEAIVAAVLQDLALETSVEMAQFGIAVPIDQPFLFYTRMLNYILLTLCFLGVTTLTRVFKRSDLKRRNLCAPISSRSFGIQQILASMVIGVVAWLLLTVLGFVWFGSNLVGVDQRILALMVLNSFILMIFGLALASMMSMFVNSTNAQQAMANIMVISLCFLGGVFMPLEFLGDNLLAISRFLPTFWNITAIDRIVELTSLDAASLEPIWQAMLIQLAFAAAMFSIALLVGKHINQSERFVNEVQTELEAV